MSYDEYCSSVHQIIHTSLYYRLSPGVYRRRGLVEYHDRRVCNGCSGYRYELSLALRKTASVSGKHRIIAVGKHAYEAVGIGQFSGGDTFLVRSVQLAVTYIIHHRSGEQIDFLKNHSKGTAQVVLPDPVYIDAVVLYLSVINIVEPVYEIGYGGLSCSCRSHQGNLLSRFGIYCYIMEHQFVFIISEIDFFEVDLSSHRNQLVAVFPGPRSRSLLTFFKLSRLVFICVD